MLAEILDKGLKLVLVGKAIAKAADELGFYYLTPNDRLWYFLEYSGITAGSVVTPAECKVLAEARKAFVLDEMYMKLFYEKKESLLLKNRVGLTHLNRRKVYTNDDDPDAEPTPVDVRKFVRKIEKFQPKAVAFITNVDTFEKCLKPLYPSATKQRGKQEFSIGTSEVWLMGSTSGRSKNTEVVEKLFDDLAERVNSPQDQA